MARLSRGKAQDRNRNRAIILASDSDALIKKGPLTVTPLAIAYQNQLNESEVLVKTHPQEF